MYDLNYDYDSDREDVDPWSLGISGVPCFVSKRNGFEPPKVDWGPVFPSPEMMRKLLGEDDDFPNPDLLSEKAGLTKAEDKVYIYRSPCVVQSVFIDSGYVEVSSTFDKTPEKYDAEFKVEDIGIASENVCELETFGALLVEDDIVNSSDYYGDDLCPGIDDGFSLCEPERVNMYDQGTLSPNCWNRSFRFDRFDGRDHVAVMRYGGFHASSGRASCFCCAKSVISFLKLIVEDKGRIFCLDCAKNYVPDAKSIRLTKHGTIICLLDVKLGTCQICHVQLEKSQMKKGRVKCRICYRRYPNETYVECIKCGILETTNLCRCPIQNMVTHLNKFKILYPVPQSYDCSVPDFDIDVSTDFNDYVSYKEHDVNFMMCRTMQLINFVSSVRSDISIDLIIKKSFCRLSDQVSFIEFVMLEPSPNANKSVVNSLKVEFQNRKFCKVNLKMFEGSFTTCAYVSDCVPDCISSVRPEVACVGYDCFSSGSQSEQYDLIVVYDQTYLIDLLRLIRFLESSLKPGGVARVRAMNIEYGTIVYQYYAECVAYNRTIKRLCFRDLEFYRYFFSVGFHVRFLPLVVISEMNFEVCLELTKIT